MMNQTRYRYVAGLLFALAANSAWAQAYPAKTVRFLTATVGGVADLGARFVAEGISGTGKLGQQVIVENRGFPAIDATAQAAPDGYTLLVYGSPVWLTELMRTNNSFRWQRDFAPVIGIGDAPMYLYAHPSLPVKTVAELLALAKRRPGDILYGSSTPGSATHLVMEFFKQRAGVNIARIPYKGGSMAAVALLQGEIQLYWGSVAVGMSQVEAGKLRVLGVASLKTVPMTPNVPTIASTGLPGFEAGIVNGILAPAKTPAAVIALVNQEAERALARPEIRDRFHKAGIVTLGGTPQDFLKKIEGEFVGLGKVIKEQNIRDE